MIKNIYYLISVLFGIIIAFVVVILFDICINNDINTDIVNFKLSDNKVLLYSMTSGTNNWIYGTEININKQGFRDVDFNTKNGDLKIICIGDSVTFGGHIDNQFLYTSILSGFLNKNCSLKTEYKSLLRVLGFTKKNKESLGCALPTM